jgi:hypothetical protein
MNRAEDRISFFLLVIRDDLTNNKDGGWNGKGRRIFRNDGDRLLLLISERHVGLLLLDSGGESNQATTKNRATWKIARCMQIMTQK